MILSDQGTLIRSGHYCNITSIYHADSKRKTPLHYACRGGNLDMVRVLLSDFKANVTIQDSKGQTALMVAAASGHGNVVHALLVEYQCPVDACDRDECTVLHYACAGGNVGIVRTLINEHNCGCDVDVKNWFGLTPLHHACRDGHLDMVRVLVSEFKADMTIQDNKGRTALMLAAASGHDNVVHALLLKYQCPVDACDRKGYTVLHHACEGGSMKIVRTLIIKCNIDVNAGTKYKPIQVAMGHRKKEVVLALINDFGCDVNCSVVVFHERSLLHVACRTDDTWLVKALIQHNANVNLQDGENNTPAHVALEKGKHDALYALLEVCNTDIRGFIGRTLLHCACARGNISLVETLIEKYNCDTNARDDMNNTPLHVAAQEGHTQVVLTLINKFGCDPNVRGYIGGSLLHMLISRKEVIEVVGKYVFPLVVDDKGDTPLHIACSLLARDNVEAVLKLNPPILLRNNLGNTSRDMIKENVFGFTKKEFDECTEISKGKVYTELQKLAGHKYSSAERITRVFVIGNPGAGKSSLIESLKREGFLESFKRVSEFSVPPHTAGIVPSIHTSKHYGRVLFYDFAGDPEYYSSHAAILENLVSSKTGENLFIIVSDLREDSATTKRTLCYWFSFIQHLKFPAKEPFLILVGSHQDELAKEIVDKKIKSLNKFCDPTNGISNKVRLFILDCCNPKSKQIVDIQSNISDLIKDSPRYKLSLSASVLLGLLEKDFRNEPAFSITSLRRHIELTGLPLHQSLLSTLRELHDLGLLFIVNSTSSNDDCHIIFNMSKLTNEVHRLLFSDEAKLTLRESCIESEGSSSFFNIGIIPQEILEKVLPPNIPKECLIQLQYCQQISHRDIGAFPSLTESTSQSFLFFPALCSVDKSDMSWATPPDLSYSIGWLARCTDPQDYFPQRFLHVLLLRLVFRLTLSPLTLTQNQAPTENQTRSVSTYFQRLCTMWKTGVHWLMREGVEYMVELVNSNREVVIITRCEGGDEELKQNCINIFSKIVSCFMEAKTDFCHSTQLQFFLLSSSEGDYLSEDNLFPIADVQNALASTHGEKVVLSINGKRQLKRAKILPLRALTLWHCIFPVNFVAVLHLLQGIVRGLYTLGLHLGISEGALDAIEDNFPSDVERRRRELVKVWLSSSQDPPCWWHLVQALKETEERVLAENIQMEHNVSVQLQEKLLAPQYHDLKQDEEFLEAFASVVGSKWPSLASSLTLTSEEIEEVRKSRQGGTLIMLKKWLTRKDATYDNLCEKLKTMSLCGL